MPGPAQPSEPIQLEGLPHAGEIIAGKYQVEKVLGAGGMGVVVYARHLLLNQPVAVKFLHPQATFRSDPVQRFMREARAAAALRSEHVARVLDVGELDSGDPYMVMEYLDGSPLSRVIRKRAPLPWPEAVDYMLQACDAIGEAHQLGIVHRDLKPGNMFITQRPNGSSLLKVLDFGISKDIGADSGLESELTATNMVMGSPQYASPEQLRSSKHVDTRTDIWSLGVILYYMLTGRRPFEADNMSALCMAIAIENPMPISTLRPDVPDGLNDVVMRCLEKDRERRIQDVPTLVAGLRPFASTAQAAQQPTAALVPVPPSMGEIPSQPSMVLSRATTEPHAATLMTRGGWAAAPSQTRKPPSVLVLQVGAALVALGAVLLIYLLKRGSAPTPAQSPDKGVTGVTPTTQVATTPPPEQPVVAPIDPVIDESFAPAPTLAAPPPAPTARSAETAQPPSSGIGKGGWGVATRPVNLLDRSGAVVGKVPKNGKVRVAREQGGWTLVVYASEDGMAMGWVPSTGLAPAPP